MSDFSSLSDKTIAVMGLGKSGLTTVRALREHGINPLAWDDSATRRKQITDPTDLYEIDFQTVDLLVLSPGIPHTYPAPHAIAKKAREAGVPIICDIELWPYSSAIGVTGTNGKSTTVSLIMHIFQTNNRPAVAGGNLGKPVFDLPVLGKEGLYILEMSSYQLERSPSVVFETGILLNITPDHLERHGGMQGYVRAKRQLLQQTQNTLIIGVDDSFCDALYQEFKDLKNVVPLSVNRPVQNGVFVEKECLIDARHHPHRNIVNLNTLPGHNWQNLLAAYATVTLYDISPDSFIEAVKSFIALPHRQEKVATIGHATYINDSKATNATASASALACYENIYWIVGGLAKEEGLDGLQPYMKNVQKAFLIGTSEDRFSDWMQRHQVPYEQCGTLERAMEQIGQTFTTPAVILLSPACASFDQFPNFEARGEQFKTLVQARQK